jgi:signal transduction histidine kinase
MARRLLLFSGERWTVSIRTRLFLGTTALALALVAVQWWLQSRQLAGLQRELATVAASVGESLILSEGAPAAAQAAAGGGAATWVAASPDTEITATGHSGAPIVISATGWVEKHESADAHSGEHNVYFHKVFVRRGDGPAVHVGVAPSAAPAELPHRTVQFLPTSGSPDEIELKVVTEATSRQHVLIVRSEPGGERRVAIPAAPAERLLRRTFRSSLLASGVLLLAGIGGAALLSHRVTRPLRALATGVEAVGMGGFGTTVPVSEAGEIGDLQRRFNTMSTRLAALEHEKEAWAAREHLAELGALARGLAHTLRNPLNTLGLAVEELSERGGGEPSPLAATARHQIRRIDRWLLSFLALGSGRAAAPEEVDLVELVRALALEMTQEGAAVAVAAAEPVVVRAVPGALRAALLNLVENAVQASPAGAEVRLAVERSSVEARVTVTDRGAGVPSEVRARLFAPHVTTKAGGAGMGLFIARQLVETGHGGTLALLDAPGGGTVAEVRLPLEPKPDAAEDAQ